MLTTETSGRATESSGSGVTFLLITVTIGALYCGSFTLGDETTDDDVVVMIICAIRSVGGFGGGHFGLLGGSGGGPFICFRLGGFSTGINPVLPSPH